jgi:hypothetical protein
MGSALRLQKQCSVVGVDSHPLLPGIVLDDFRQHDLNLGLPPLLGEFNYILLLDVIEHLSSPERFIEILREAMKLTPDARLVVSTANVGFAVLRLMLLLGQFNYGKRGILDLTHTRLFTFASLRRAFDQGGFRIIKCRGIPAPFPLALGDSWLGHFLVRFNKLLIGLSKGLFSYQMLFVLQPSPSLDYLLQTAEKNSALRAQESRVSAGASH